MPSRELKAGLKALSCCPTLSHTPKCRVWETRNSELRTQNLPRVPLSHALPHAKSGQFMPIYSKLWHNADDRDSSRDIQGAVNIDVMSIKTLVPLSQAFPQPFVRDSS